MRNTSKYLKPPKHNVRLFNYVNKSFWGPTLEFQLLGARVPATLFLSPPCSHHLQILSLCHPIDLPQVSSPPDERPETENLPILVNFTLYGKRGSEKERLNAREEVSTGRLTESPRPRPRGRGRRDVITSPPLFYAFV